jgi:hypothetical protein
MGLYSGEELVLRFMHIRTRLSKLQQEQLKEFYAKLEKADEEIDRKYPTHLFCKIPEAGYFSVDGKEVSSEEYEEKTKLSRQSHILRTYELQDAAMKILSEMNHL